MNYQGDYKEDATIYLMFNTFTSNDPSASSTITNFANTDVHIHKDDDLTQRNNAAGITVSINFDGITGSHMIKIDTNDNTVAGFWVTGKDYFVRIEGTTIDGATINAVVGHFSIENRHNEVDVVKWLGQTCHAVSENGVPKVDLDQIGGVVQSLTDFKDLVDTGYDPATHKVQGVVLTDTITTYTGNTKQTANNNTILAHADYGLAKLVRSTTPANKLDVSVTGEAGLDFANIKNATGAHTLTNITIPVCTTNTDMVGTDNANTVVPDAAGVAATPAEVATALTNIHLDHLLAADYDPASKPGVATALLNELVENDGGVSRYTANALEQAPSGGTNPNVLVSTTVASVTDQTHFTLTAGSNDDDAYKDQAITMYDASDNDYPSVRKCSAYTGTTKTVTLDSAPDFTIVNGDGIKAFVTAPGTTAPTASQNADAVLDEILSGHVNAGSLGKKIGDQANPPSQTLNDYKAAGFATPTNITAGTIATVTNLTNAPTNGDLTATMKTSVNTEADTALTDYDPPTKAEMDTAHTLLATEAKQDIIDTNVDQIEAAVITNAAGVDVAADIIAVKAETASILTDTGTTLQGELDGIQADTEDIQARLPAALSGGNIKADVLAISTSTAAADNLEASAETIVTGAAAAGTLSTTQMTTDLTEATNDHYNGCIIIWTSGVLKDQRTDVTDYDGTSKKLTYTATTEAPSAGDTFNLV